MTTLLEEGYLAIDEFIRLIYHENKFGSGAHLRCFCSRGAFGKLVPMTCLHCRRSNQRQFLLHRLRWLEQLLVIQHLELRTNRLAMMACSRWIAYEDSMVDEGILGEVATLICLPFKVDRRCNIHAFLFFQASNKSII